MNRPNNCTIELANGGIVHVAHSDEEILAKITMARQHRVNRVKAAGVVHADIHYHGTGLVTLTRSEGTHSRAARGFPEIHLNPDHIVGIFPLTSESAKGKE